MPKRLNVIPFPQPSDSPSGHSVPQISMILGRFTPEQKEDIRRRFFKLGNSVEQLARVHGCGNHTIQEVIRMRRPPTIALVNDRRGKRTA